MAHLQFSEKWTAAVLCRLFHLRLPVLVFANIVPDANDWKRAKKDVLLETENYYWENLLRDLRQTAQS